VQWGRLKFRIHTEDEEAWGVHPQGDMNLIDHIWEHTSVNLNNRWNVADVENLDEMVRFPFLFMHSEGKPVLTEAGRKNLREYMLRGGFVFAEDCVVGRFNGNEANRHKSDFFFLKMVEEFPKILPEAKLEKLPHDHPIYHTVFHLKNGLPKMQGTEHGGWGLSLRGRLVAFLSPADNHCGWTNGDKWFGRENTIASLQFGTNLYIYAMTQSALGDSPLLQ
jgi:Domain of unknown function (DUF4159)